MLMTKNVPQADPENAEVAEEYKEDVLVVGVPKAFTNFPLTGSCPRQAPVHNPYFSALIMLVCVLSFEEKDL
jgi:hypothetical protein